MFYYRNRTFTFILNEKNIEIHNNYLCRIFLILISFLIHEKKFLDIDNPLLF